MNITVNQKEFWDFLHNDIDLDSYEFKFLRSKLNRIHAKKSVLYSESLLNKSKAGWILILLSDSIIVHGNNWSKTQLDQALSMLDLTRFKNYLIEGNNQLIHDILKQAKVSSYSIEKERCFYRLKVANKLNNENHLITMPESEDISAIASFLKQYYHEEYKGRNDKLISEMKSKVDDLISMKSIFVLKNDALEIISFCTLLDPDIGILFTAEHYRNKGFGSVLLSYCTNHLLAQNDEVYLMTDKNDGSSNSTCKKVGFKSFFNYSYLRINNS